jgi:hypothetical protein
MSRRANKLIVWLRGLIGFVGIVLHLFRAGGREPHSPPSMHQGGCFIRPRRTGTFLAGAGIWLLLLLLWQCQDTSFNTAGTACHTARYTARYTASCTVRYTARCTARYTACYTARRSLLKKAIVHRALAIIRGVSCWCSWQSIAWRNKNVLIPT